MNMEGGMNKGLKVIAALVLVAVVAGAAVFFTQKDDSSKDNDKNGTNSNAEASVTITYDGEQFSPAEVTVASGGTVIFVNQSDEDVEPSSDPHPVHTTNPELNAGEIAPGDDATLTVTDKGEWGYHNHFDSSQTGTVTVE
jgi:plastocyanin